jgi:hypothetical protein
MSICEDVPHCPAAGVKVYEVLPTFAVLIELGLQVPLTPSFDVGGSTGAVAFWQYESAIVGKVGERLATIVTFKIAGVAQLPADDGVNL